MLSTPDQLRALCGSQQRELQNERLARGASALLAVLSAWRSTALWRAWARWAETSLAWELEALTVRMAHREADLRRVKQDAAAARESSSQLLARLEGELEERNARLLEMRASLSNSGEARLDQPVREANATLKERAREVGEARVRRLGGLLAGVAALKQSLALSRWRVATARLPSTDGRGRDRRFGSQSGSPEIAPLDRAALEASHAQLSTRARLLQRRLDGLVTEKERLQAQANERDRELRHEAAALRAALLAAGGAARGHVRGSSSPAQDMVGAAEASEAEATLERAALRRRAADLSADNALLTQNFMLLKSRLADVVAMRDVELQDLARDRDVREAAVRREAASTGRVLEAVLRGSLREAEGAHALLRHAGAARRLAGAVAAGQAAMMQSALWRWHQAMFVGERLSRQTLEARAAGLQERTTMLLGRALSRLPDALSRAALPLVAAVQRWRAAVAAISHGESLASRADLEARLGMVSTRLASATFDSQASASQADERVAALQRDLSEASGRLQQLMSERRNAQDALATLERERGGLGSLLQQAQAELATAQAAVEAAALKREQVAREKDVLWRELHSREAKSKSEIENEHTARLHGEALRLRAQLEASEREREALLSNAATASKLQATLHAHAQQHELFAQQQQAAARSAYLARAVTLQHTPGYGVYPSPTQPSDWMLRSQSRYQVSFPLD